MFKDNSIKSVQAYFDEKLKGQYALRDVQLFTELCLEAKFGLSKTDLILSVRRFSESELLQIIGVIKRLKNNEPIQYILETVHFYGLNFKVTSGALIPRPETEELVDLIVKSKAQGRIVDIGTGTGIIPVSLAKNLSNVEIHAIDVSPDALKIAEYNALENKVKVQFHLIDILESELPIEDIDLVVSNPPYVLESDKKVMSPHVLEYEPHLALFVDDNNPLVFYKRIVRLADQKLKAGGFIYLEIHENFGQEMLELLSHFKKVELLQDLQGKDRFIVAEK